MVEELLGPLAGIFAAMFAGILVLGILLYVYFAFALYTIAKKTNTENPWIAWIPIIQFWTMVQIAKLEWWWVIGAFIPVVNFVWMIYIFVKIAQARNYNPWSVVLLFVPIVNLVYIGFLAWKD